jgi:hypothetical protein
LNSNRLCVSLRRFHRRRSTIVFNAPDLRFGGKEIREHFLLVLDSDSSSLLAKHANVSFQRAGIPWIDIRNEVACGRWLNLLGRLIVLRF